MHKLLKADIFLIVLTILGILYLYMNAKISIEYAIFILFIYLFSKIIAYLILPYSKFEIFLNYLTETSKLPFLSGFEIFKIVLVVLLFLGFIFINPLIWVIESILVITMRIWGLAYIANHSKIKKETL